MYAFSAINQTKNEYERHDLFPIDKRQLILEIAEEVAAKITPKLQPPVQEDELIQIPEAMKLLGRSRTTINNWRCPSHFPTCPTVLEWGGEKNSPLNSDFLNKNRKTSLDVILSYLAVCPWTLMPPMAYLQVNQLTEVLLTNGGFIVITILFIRNMIDESRKDSETLVLIQTKDMDEIFIIRCTDLGLTKRKIQICDLVREGRITKKLGRPCLSPKGPSTNTCKISSKKTEARIRLNY